MFLIEIRTWFGLTSIEQQKKADMMATHSSFSLMIQQLCNDLVYTMLYTVTKHTVGITKQGRWTVYQPYDFSNKNKFVIENMLVKKSFYSKSDTIGETTDGGLDFEEPIGDGLNKQLDTTRKSEFEELKDKQDEVHDQLVQGRTTEKRIE